MHKWNTPYEWLCSKVSEWDALQLQQELLLLAGRMSSDEIQDVYQDEMDKDGYFTEIAHCPECGRKIEKNTDCEHCIRVAYDAAEWAADERQREQDILNEHEGGKANKAQDRMNRLMPNGIPRYVRCYDNGGLEVGGTIDRYTVVFTGNYRRDGDWFLHLGMSEEPNDPAGFCQHGSSPRQIDTTDGGWAVSVGGKSGHLGTRIEFTDLPIACQGVVLEDYKDIWRLEG